MKPGLRTIALLLLCRSIALQAAEDASPQTLTEQDYLGEVPTVLTASRLAQPLDEAPAAVTVIDRETIRAAGIVDIADIFRLVPGMYVGQNAGYFHTVNPTVSYHGLTDAYSRRMQVLVDGRSVYAPLYGGVQWSDLALAVEDIARIEVTRGPNAASYGANSFLGVINIITQHSSETLGNMAVLTSGGDRKGITLRHGGSEGDLQYRITAGVRLDDGVQNREDDKRIEMMNFRADYRASERDELEFQFGYNGGGRREGMLREDPLLFLPRTKQVTSHFEQFNWRRTLGPDSEFKLQAYHSYDKSDDQVVSADLTGVVAPIPLLDPRLRFNNEVYTERYDLEAQHSFSPSKTTRIAWGGSVRLDRAQSELFLGDDNTDSFRLERLFGQLEWTPIQRLVLNAGAMVEHNSITGTDITPRASANFKIAPGHTLRVGISTATRTPTLLEEKFNTFITVPTAVPGLTLMQQLYYDRGGLQPERITSREIGYLGNIGVLSLDGRLFHDEIRDMIDQYRTTFPVSPGLTPTAATALSYRNSSDLTVHGFEMQAQLRLGPQTRVIANYSHVRINPDMDDDFTSSGEASRFRDLRESMPIDSFSLLAWHRLDSGWMGSIGYYQSGETKMPGDGNRVDFERHWDARIARSFMLGRTRNEISITSQNVLREDYQEFAQYNQMGRRTFVQYRLDF